MKNTKHLSLSRRQNPHRNYSKNTARGMCSLSLFFYYKTSSLDLSTVLNTNTNLLSFVLLCL